MADDSDKKGDREFQVITSALDDCRRLIAAGKVLRWDVVKWGAAINIALATAAAAPAFDLRNVLWFFVLAWAVASVGLALVGHYNTRMSGARETATTLADRLSSFEINYNEITKPKEEPKPKPVKTNRFWNFLSRLKPPLSYEAGEYYDWQELWIFTLILGLSPFLVLLSLVAKS